MFRPSLAKSVVFVSKPGATISLLTVTMHVSRGVLTFQPCTDTRGMTSVMMAVILNKRHLVRLLAKLGARLDVYYDRTYRTPAAFEFALENPRVGMIEDLLKLEYFNVEMTYSQVKSTVTMRAIRHGVQLDVKAMVLCLHRIAIIRSLGCQYERVTDRFFRSLVLASADRQRLRRYTEVQPTTSDEALWRYRYVPKKAVVSLLLDMLSKPLSLQECCVVTIRSSIRGCMWRGCDALTLPKLLRDMLKLEDV